MDTRISQLITLQSTSAMIACLKKLMCAACLLLVLTAAAQDKGAITLKPIKSDYALKNFSIDSIIDGRSYKSSIGSIDRRTPIKLADGVVAALKKHAAEDIQQDHSQTPISVTASRLYFTVVHDGDTWVTDASVAFTFSTGGMNLVEFSDSGHQEAGAYSPDYIESFIRQGFEGSLKQFDEWWPVHKDKIPVSGNAKVNVSIATTSDKEGYIIYSLNRPLVIPDFRGPYPDDNGPEMAETGSGIGINISGGVVEGQVTLTVVLTPFFIKNESWFKPEGKTERVLEHEQTHFDITAAKTCELFRAIHNTTFTKEDYQQKLQDLHKQYTTALNEEENLYDTETNHGVIADKQLQWQQRIKSQLGASGCY